MQKEKRRRNKQKVSIRDLDPREVVGEGAQSVAVLSNSQRKLIDNVQGEGRKFLGHFQFHFRSLIPETLKQGHLYRIKPISASKASLNTVYKQASPQYTTDCFADISTQEVCTVTWKLDLDQRQRSMYTRTSKYRNVIKFTFRRQFWVYRLIWPCLYDSNDINLWPKMAFKLSHEFPTASWIWLNIIPAVLVRPQATAEEEMFMWTLLLTPQDVGQCWYKDAMVAAFFAVLTGVHQKTYFCSFQSRDRKATGENNSSE